MTDAVAARALVVSLSFERADIDTLLTASAGTDPASVTQYRPYLVAAILLQTARNTSNVLEAKGARFSSHRETITELMRLQQRADTKLELTIPDGYAVRLGTTYSTGF